MTNDSDISERLARLESEMAVLKERAGSSGLKVSNELVRTSQEFVKAPTSRLPRHSSVSSTRRP